MYLKTEYYQMLVSMSSISGILAVLINQTYLALYFIDMKLIEYQCQSKLDEDYFMNKRLAMKLRKEPVDI